MTERALNCLRCQATMEAGFIVDKVHDNVRGLAEWVEGEPERSFWTGLKTKGHEKYFVRTYRCTRCGYLESYAVNPVA
jgi:hypothetical protein